MNTSSCSHRLTVCFALLMGVSFALAFDCQGAPAQLSAPSQAMKKHECKGFTLSLPSNWTVSTLPSGVSYCAAADGKKVAKDASGGTMVSMYQGLVAGIRETGSPSARAAADEMIKEYERDNPGLRVIRHEAATIGGLPADSVLIESPTGRGGELERSLMLFVRNDGRMFFAAFTSPARDYGKLEKVFKRVADSIRFTSW